MFDEYLPPMLVDEYNDMVRTCRILMLMVAFTRTCPGYTRELVYDPEFMEWVSNPKRQRMYRRLINDGVFSEKE